MADREGVQLDGVGADSRRVGSASDPSTRIAVDESLRLTGTTATGHAHRHVRTSRGRLSRSTIVYRDMHAK